MEDIGVYGDGEDSSEKNVKLTKENYICDYSKSDFGLSLRTQSNKNHYFSELIWEIGKYSKWISYKGTIKINKGPWKVGVESQHEIFNVSGKMQKEDIVFWCYVDCNKYGVPMKDYYDKITKEYGLNYVGKILYRS